MIVYSSTGLFSMKKKSPKKKSPSKKKKPSVGKRLRNLMRKSEKWIATHPNLVATAMNLANIGINAKLAFGGYKIKHE